MQQQKPARVYGMTKIEYARLVQEMETHQSHQHSDGIFARLTKKFR